MKKHTPIWEMRTQHILTDEWFRMLEFSLLLGGLHYFMDKSGGLTIKIIYWISWFMFFAWFLELASYFTSRFHTKGYKWLLIYSISVLIFIFIFLLVTNIANNIVSIK